MTCVDCLCLRACVLPAANELAMGNTHRSDVCLAAIGWGVCVLRTAYQLWGHYVPAAGEFSVPPTYCQGCSSRFYLLK